MEKYEDLVVIGQGQYGTAFRATDKRDGQLYCIKRIPMSAKDDHAGALREAQLLDSLDHPNIIRYRESFVDKDGSLCIVTSFCEEGDLFTRIRKKAAQREYFTEEEVMNMFVQTASAISYIHSKRILHRDLKTQNIFIARGGIIKLGDFGISKVLERTDSFATTVTGTPYYMAPEICTNQPYTYKSDIWSLGCVLYELCTLKHAFAADSLLSLVYQIVRGTFPPIPTDQFTSGLSDLVNRLLARDANTRPSLGEVFKLPYVQRNLDRFKAEEQRRNLKQSTILTRRKQLLDATPAAGESDANLTPKQRMERKKEQDRQRRELELRLAAMSANKNHAQAAARKKEMLHGSNTGLPGAHSPLVQRQQHSGRGASAGGFEDDDLPNMGTVRIDDLRPPPAPPARPGKSIWDLDEPDAASPAPVDPYAATLPSQARIQQQQGGVLRPSSQQAPTRGPAVGGLGRPGAAALTQQQQQPQQRPGSTLGGSRGGGAAEWGVGMDDDVLQGTVRSQVTHTSGFQATASAFDQGAGRGQWGDTWDRNGLGDDMPNMGTVQLTHGFGQSLGQPTHGSSPSRAMDYTFANRTNASDSPLMGSVNLGNSRTLGAPPSPQASPAPAARPGSLGGAGGTGSRPTSGVAADRPILSYRAGSGAASPDVRRGPPAPQATTPVAGRPASGVGAGARGLPPSPHQPPQPAAPGMAAIGNPQRGVAGLQQQQQRNNLQPQHHHHHHHRADDDEDDGAYSDDFEEDDEDEGVVQQRSRIIQNVEDMASRAYDGRDTIAAVQERVKPAGANSDKARALRQGCEAQLGSKFAPVYEYLGRVRRQEPPPEEREVQRRLLEIVGDKARMPGCFMVDQLVFTEAMYS